MFDKMFNIGDVQNFLDTMVTAANQKAVAAKEVANVAVREKGAIADSAAQYQETANKTMERLKTVEAQGDESRRLAESGNVFDRITLIGEQILNPRAYTREGRQNQVSEMSQNLAAQGQVHNVNVVASEARVDEALAVAQMQTLDTDAKASALRAQVDGMQLATQSLLAANTMKQTNLAMTDLPTIQKTLMGPMQNDKAAVNGMEYTKTELLERENALTTRNQLAMLSPQATDPEFDAKLQVHHNMQLATYGIPELETLKNNGYMMPDGTQVNPQVWDTHYSRQNAMQQEALQTQMNALTLENQVPAMLTSGTQMIQQIAPFVTPGTPLAAARTRYTSELASVAKLAESTTTPQGKLLQVAAMQKAEEGFVKAVQGEALRKAAGDKELAGIYQDQMLGAPIAPARVEDILRQRYVKGNGFGEVLPTEMATRVRDSADKELAKLRQENAQAGMDPMRTTLSDKELKEEAVNRAFQRERLTAGTRGINTIQLGSTERKDNPAIIAGMIPGGIRELQQRAAIIALDNVGQAEGLNESQILALRNGDPEAAGLSKEKASLVASKANIESVMVEYDLYEEKEVGLGYKMRQWYAQVLPEMARNYSLKLGTMEQAIVGDSVLEKAMSLEQRYTVADESATDRGRKMVMELSTGVKKPENMWPVLLQTSERLADSQRSTLYYDVIAPAIKQARATGANDQVATQAVFDALKNYQSPDNVMMASVRNLLRELPTALDKFEVTWNYVLYQNQPLLRRDGRQQYTTTDAGKQIQSVIPWMNKGN